MPPIAMKAVIPQPDPTKPPCLVYWTGRSGFSVQVLTYCNEERNAAPGVLQVPDDVKCCAECERAVTDRRYPQRR